MNEQSNPALVKLNVQGRPLRRRGVSFNVLPVRKEPISKPTPETPVLVDYAAIRERKQLHLNDFLRSDNPITFFLFTFWHAVCFFAKLFVLPFVLIRYFYRLMLRVYGVRRPTTSSTKSDLCPISSPLSSPSQQRPIVWILTLIDYIIIQLTRLPETVNLVIDSILKHVNGTVSKSFNLIDAYSSHQITRIYSILKDRIAFKN